MQKVFFMEKMTIENFQFLKKQITTKEYLWYLIQKIMFFLLSQIIF